MKKLLLLLSMTAMILPLSCSKPDPEQGPEEPGNENTTPEVPTYKVGDYYKVGLAKGIVVAVNEDGTSGLVMSLDEENLMWAAQYEDLVGAVPVTMEDGHTNCEAIKSFVNNWVVKYPALAWCSKKNPGSLTSWYLPAAFELEAIWNASHEIQEEFNAALVANGGTELAFGMNDCYWSSTHAGASLAYAFNFGSGEIDNYAGDKMKKNRVRCVRKF